MVRNNTSSLAREVKKVYFVHDLCSKNKKCTGVQNCKALKNAGFTPPPYYLKSSSTDTFDWDEQRISKNVAKYYKTSEKNMKNNNNQSDKLKKKGRIDNTVKSDDLYTYDNTKTPKNLYVYKRKHLVQEITIPRQIKTSIANLYRPHRIKIADIVSNEKKESKNKDKKKKHQQSPNTCKCSENKGKKNKVEIAILSNAEKDIEQLDQKFNSVCKCGIYKNAAKKKKFNKCDCKVDKIDDESAQKSKKYNHKQLREKDKIMNFYHEFKKKVQFDDVPPEGNEVQEYKFDTNNSNIKNDFLSDERCQGGTCAKAAKDKNYDFICKCVERKKKPQETECINAICTVTSTSTVAKIRKKIILLCNKYSHILKEKKIIPYTEKTNDKQICNVGLCRTAFDNKKDNFTCKCVKNTKECTDTSCTPASEWRSSFIKKYYKFFMKSHKDEAIDKISSKRNAIDQTGEPFFELKVDSIGLCALNPTEIRTKVEELGKSQKQNNCICLSHNKAHKKFLQKAVCSRGICEKKYKNKKTGFRCVCSNNQSHICTDSTCEPDKNNISWLMNNDNPLMEVKFSTKDMSILNTKEIRDQISVIKTKLRGVCSAGICREAVKDKVNYVCKCSQKKLHMDIGECKDNICKKWGKGVKSKISCTCARKSSTVVEDKLQNTPNPCDEHCIGDPKTCICCKCMKNRKQFLDRKSNHTRRQKNFHKRKGFSIPSIIPNKFDDSNTFLKCKKVLSSSFSALLQRVESRRHKFKRTGLNIHLTNKQVNKTGNKQLDTINVADTCCLCGKHRKDCNCKYSSERTGNQYLSPSLSAIKNRYPQLAKHHIKDATIKVAKDLKRKKADKAKDKSISKRKKGRDKICMCYHTCECGLIQNKENIKSKKLKAKLSSLSRTQRIRQLKNKRKKDKSRTHDTIRRRKEYLKEQEHFRKELKKKEKAEKKNKEKLLKIEKAELEAISKGREAEDTSCFADFFLGILKFVVFILKWVFTILFKIILDPKGSYVYIQLKLLDPLGTFKRISKTISDAWRIKKLQMLKSISGSDKMTILTDTLQDTAIFQAFADKGKTPNEKRIIAQKNKQRKLRMEQRTTRAFRSCKHNLLHTLRKTPCLWVYHICPFFYPQCLGLLALMKQMTEILLFMLAFIVWTPCIACCETCRAFCCCVLCTN